MKKLRIIEVSAADVGGGAERVCLNLTEAFRKKGHECILVAGKKQTRESWIFEARFIEQERLKGRIKETLRKGIVLFPKRARLLWLALRRPKSFLDVLRGREDFNFPWTERLYKVAPFAPDILHLHNLHGGYFDLRVLPSLSKKVPTVLTVHDQWLFTGHCAHSLECNKWRTGCGNCPDLSRYPAIKKDATAFNWKRKKLIYERSRLYVSTPSKWLLDMIRESILSPAVVEAKVIPNGVDLRTFSPGDKMGERLRLGWAPEESVVLLCGRKIGRSPWRDLDTTRKGLELVSRSWQKCPVKVVVLGDEGPSSRWGNVELFFEPFKDKPSEVASFLRAADIFFHPSKADTSPNVVVEAMACRIPVVATAVGGIPELVKGLKWDGHPAHEPSYGREDSTGLLVRPQDPEAVARAITLLLADAELRADLGKNGTVEARRSFDLEKQVGKYLSWFDEILGSKTAGPIKYE